MLAHELAHILLHQKKGNYTEHEEKEAHLFATMITLRYLILHK